MAKFYVESGNLQIVVHAKNARGAAIWAIHRAMSQMLPFLSQEPQTLLDANRAPIRLGELMKTSEQGFGRSDASMHDTFDVATEWNRLMVALDKLQEEAATEVTAV
jgi:Lon protease-like protein